MNRQVLDNNFKNKIRIKMDLPNWNKELWDFRKQFWIEILSELTVIRWLTDTCRKMAYFYIPLYSCLSDTRRQ